VEGKNYIQAFGTPSGHRVLRDLISNFDNSEAPEGEGLGIIAGRRQVVDFIKRRLKQECGKDKKIYADIMFEIELL
jgi:hypothetical protein